VLKKVLSVSTITLFMLVPGILGVAEDTSRIVFVSDRIEGTDLYVMDSDGMNLFRITWDGEEKGEPAWSYDGRSISYHCIDEAGRMGIYVIRNNGAEQRKLSNVYDMGAVWSPDEPTMAFYSYRSDNWEIYLMNSDGMNLQNISDHPDTDTYPSWAPAGDRLTFHTQRDGNWEIYTMNSDGTDQRRLTQNNARDWVPAWSPDGKKIAFWSDRGGIWQVYTMNPDGSNKQKITDEPGVKPKAISRCAWSPDSKSLAYVSIRDGNSEIYVIDADGSNLRRLTFTEYEEYDPAWSPF